MLIGNWMTGNEEDPDMMSPRPIRYAAVCTKSSSLFSHAQCGGKINPADCELASTWLDKLEREKVVYLDCALQKNPSVII
jgi:hypothetical protein